MSPRYQFLWVQTTPWSAWHIESFNVPSGNTFCYLQTIWPSAHLALFVLTMKISAQWCRVDTSYFTHNWETRGGGSILFLSVQVQRTCPLPPPPKCDFRKEIVLEQTSQHTNTRMWKDITGCSIKYTESAVSNTQNLQYQIHRIYL